MSWMVLIQAHVLSWKLGPGFILLAKVCPSKPYAMQGALTEEEGSVQLTSLY